MLVQAFRLLRQVKGLRIHLQTAGRFQMFSLYVYLYLSLFTLPYLHLLAHTYLHLLIYTYVLFMLLCELDKIVEIGEYRNYDKIF